MKRRILVLLLALVVCFTSSCDLLGGVSNQGSVTVVIENGDGSFDVTQANLGAVENKEEGAKGVLDYLSQGKDKLHVKMEDGAFGAYITEIGNLKNSANGYIMVYTSVSSDSYEGAPTINYEGMKLYQSGVGVSQMKVEDGGVILFRLEIYEF